MRTTVPFQKIRVSMFIASLFVGGLVKAQTYTTIANGAWSSASTWQNGTVPSAGAIAAGVTINIKHVVTYSTGNIDISGTLNISNSNGITPKLVVPNSINITLKSGGKLNITNAELRQYRFAGGGESGSNQSGNFTNTGGTLTAVNSFIEIAQTWKDNAGGKNYFNNCSIAVGQDFSSNAGTTDSLLFTSVSTGMQGSGDFSVTGGTVFYKGLRVEIANPNGQFALNGGTVNGIIDYITMTNHLTKVQSSNKITIASGVTTTGITINAYCAANGKYKPANGKAIGLQIPSCGLSYFPAGLMNGTNSSRLNFSTNPVLVSGTNKQVGAKYKYESVSPGIDAVVSIDSLVNGAVIDSFDDNSGTNGGFIEAFQPIITSGPSAGTSYAVFTFNYKVSGTSTPMNVDTASITALDIDGGNNVHEFDQISLGIGAQASYMATNPLIKFTQLLTGVYKAVDQSGLSRNGVDTGSKANMFTVTNTGVSTFTAKLGIVTTGSTNTQQRLFSLYAKSFNYANTIILPVKLETFTADYTKPNVMLAWKSADETNFSHYELQHSFNGKDFSATAIVFAEGGNALGASYTYTDKSVKNTTGVIYYRLKMVDNDGQFTYSAVRAIHLGDEQVITAMSVYPNPATDNASIRFPASWQNKAVTVQLFNANGQQVNTYRFDNGNTQTIQTSSLNKGIYFIRATAGFESLTSQVIKN